MKTLLYSITAVCLISGAAYAQNPNVIVENRDLRKPNLVVTKPIAFRSITLSEAKADGKQLKATDMVKTLSGKSITVEDYLKRINSLESEMTKKGYTLRDFKPESNSLKMKPVILAPAAITTANRLNSANLKPVITMQARMNKIFLQNKPSGELKAISRAEIGKIIAVDPKQPAIPPASEEQNHNIATLLKPLTDKINQMVDDDQAKLEILNASLVVKSYAEAPPASTEKAALSVAQLYNTNSEYKVAVNFNATVKGSFGLPVTLTIPVATLNGEFISPSNKDKKLSRKVVVNLMGKSLFNRTSVVNADVLNEEEQEELDLSELLQSPRMNANNFMDWIPSVTFNTRLSNLGSVGCMYKADMTKTNVNAYIGPTFSARIRLSASFGIEDVLEGGIEGIATLLRGGIGFGGNAGLKKEGNQWKLINKSYIESSLEALEAEVNFFVRYPDLSNWSCWGPCIKKETLPIFKTPVAFAMNGTLLENDKGKVLPW